MPKINPLKPLQYGTRCSSGADVYSEESLFLHQFKTVTVRTGVFLEFHEAEMPAFEVQIRPKSSLSSKGVLVHWGTVDGDYKGEIMVCMTNLHPQPFEINKGDKIAQIVLAPVARFDNVNIKDVERGAGGFGSTGKRVETDAIRPGHYGKGTYEVINIINAWGLDFNTGNVLKYIARAGKKAGATVKQDLEKALQYAKFHKEKLQYYSGSGIYEAISDEYNRKSVSAALFSENPHGANCIYYLCTNNVDKLIASLESWIAAV